jgi:hypothetical protein
MKKSKTELRAEWIASHAEEIKKAKCAEEGSTKNAYYRRGMSGGGWGYWVWAFRRAGVDCSAQNYWSGSAPTPSTAINRGIAEFVSKFAPSEIN